jgi:hypothetical protein
MAQSIDRKIIIDTDRKEGQIFKVHEYDGRFTVYRIESGIIFSDSRKIGETRSLEDAITLIKTSVAGTVRNVNIKNW